MFQGCFVDAVEQRAELPRHGVPIDGTAHDEHIGFQHLLHDFVELIVVERLPQRINLVIDQVQCFILRLCEHPLGHCGGIAATVGASVYE